MGRGGCSGGGFSGGRGGSSGGGFSSGGGRRSGGRSSSGNFSSFAYNRYASRARRHYHVPVGFNFYACPSYRTYATTSGKLISIFFAMIILIVIASVLAFSVSIGENNQYITVKATAISNSYHRDYLEPSDPKNYYFTTYRYTVDGVTYIEESRVGWDEPETVGNTVTICYNKNLPTDILEKDAADVHNVDYYDSSGTKMLTVISVILYVIAGILLLVGIITLIKNIKARKSLDGEVQTQMAGTTTTRESAISSLSSNVAADNVDEVFSEFPSGSTPKTNKIKRCEYCGSAIDETMDKCPNCGAIVH